MEETLSSLATWGYIAIAFFSLGGSLVIVAAAGVFSAMGKIDLTTAMIVAMVFNFIGDNLLFYMSRYQRSSMMPYLRSHHRKLALATIMYRRYGSIVMFVKKFIYGLKTLVPLSMGLSKYNFGKFILINLFASIFFVLVIGLGGYYAAESITIIFNIVKEKPWIAPIILFSVLGTIWFLMEKATTRK
jgi:membrane protein DedA with SNARE-associated domain